jgi:excisionase family DNA binding protein
MATQTLTHRPTGSQGERTGPAPLLAVGEVAAILGLSRATVWRMADAGELARVRIGSRAVRFRVSDVEALIEDCTDPTNGDAPVGNTEAPQEVGDADAQPSG